MDVTPPACNDNELDLVRASREELIEEIHRLRKQVAELRGKRSATDKLENLGTKRLTKRQRQGKLDRPFDFSKFENISTFSKMSWTSQRWRALFVIMALVFASNNFLVCSAKKSEFVDPTNMGSYHHVDRQNIEKHRLHYYTPHNVEEERIRRTAYYKSNKHESNLELPLADVSENNVILQVIEETRRTSDSYKSQENIEEGQAGMIYLKRVIASLLRQLQVLTHTFGPKEAITIDLQAEISHEDLTALTNFIASKSQNHSQPLLVRVDNIISNMFHVVSAVPTIGFYDYFKETIGIGVLFSLKFWLTLFSSFVVFMLTIILLMQTYTARTPCKIIACGIALFFILSCVWNFLGSYEKAKALNVARLHQYQAVPKDCDFDNLGHFDTLGYYIRVHLIGHEDRCAQYNKEMFVDPFFGSSPVEAISDTFSKLVFHPMEYIGLKLGKLFGGIVTDVPFWLKPLLLLLVFTFLILGIFGYSIRTPFLSIEPAQRVYPQLEGSPHREQVNPAMYQQIIERPPAEVVRAAAKDASTSTDDLEDYIRNYENDLGHQPFLSSQWQDYFNIILATCSSAWTIIVQFLSFILREVPEETAADVIIPENQEMPQIPDPLPFAEPDPVLPNPVAVIENPAPVIENPAPVMENPAPVMENPALVFENPALVIENPVPVIENHVPIVEQEPRRDVADNIDQERILISPNGMGGFLQQFYLYKPS